MRSGEMGNARIKWNISKKKSSMETNLPFTYLENGIQTYKLDPADCLKWIHYNKENNHNSTKLSKAMLQGNVIMNWIEMYIAIDEFKTYLPHQPQLKSVNAMK